MRVFVCMRHTEGLLLSVCRLQPKWVYCMFAHSVLQCQLAMCAWTLYGLKYADTPVNTACFWFGNLKAHNALKDNSVLPTL